MLYNDITDCVSLHSVFKGSKIILHLEEGRKVEIGNGDVVGKRAYRQFSSCLQPVSLTDIVPAPFSATRNYTCLGKPYR